MWAKASVWTGCFIRYIKDFINIKLKSFLSLVIDIISADFKESNTEFGVEMDDDWKLEKFCIELT